MKRKMALLLVAIFFLGTCTELAQANPYGFPNFVPPPPGSTPLKITVFSPQNNTVQKEGNINITLNISSKSTSMLSVLDASLKADWREDNSPIYEQKLHSYNFQSWNYSKVFSNISDGEHKVVIYASGNGEYLTNEQHGTTANLFDMTAMSTVVFTIDSEPPQVSVNSPATNASYSQAYIPLNFTISENPMQMTYSLDGQENQTYSQNSTLIGLPEGNHNLTVYAWDRAGNVGASETIYFAVTFPKPLQINNVIVPIVGVVVVAAGVLIYLKKRRP